MKRIYIVIVEHKASGTQKVSQTAFSEYDKAVAFIRGRSDKVKKIMPFLFESEENKYYINDMEVI